MPSSPKHITFNEALDKARKYCAYQERCYYEVETKVKELGLHYEFVAPLCMQLSDEGYLNEERFASAYVRGKFNQNSWGRLKITQGLKQKRLSPKMIEISLTEIDEKKYRNRILELLTKKLKTTKYKSPFELKQKLFRFGVSKGFETALIQIAIDEIVD